MKPQFTSKRHKIPDGFFLSPIYPELAFCRDGRVWSIKLGKERKFSPERQGYLRATTFCNRVGKRRSFYKHRLLAEVFLGYQEGMTVNHKDGNKFNDAEDNLEWVTRRDNIRHAYDVLKSHTGLKTQKFSDEVILTIFSLFPAMSQGKLAKNYNVPQSTISRILSGKRYRNLNLCD